MKYCLGFAFSLDRSKVLVIRKKRPAWQAGRLNGIGGKLEAGETALLAMQRECQEETGLNIPDWEYFATIESPHFEVTCFRAFTDDIYGAVSLTDEKVTVEEVNLQRFFLEGNPSVAPLMAHALRPDSGTITIPGPEHPAASVLDNLVVMSCELRAPDAHGDGQVLLDRVRRRGTTDAWVVRKEGRALNVHAQWEWEGRAADDEVRLRTRFPDERTAMNAWTRHCVLSQESGEPASLS
jgi:8-oxo-dGTP diphosphatase